MALLSRFDLSSNFTLFFLGLAVFFIVLGIVLSRVSPKGRSKSGGRKKFDDTIVDRNRELID